MQTDTDSDKIQKSTTKQTIRMEYCTQCGWLLRASWMAQELLTTFSDDLDGLTLIPSSGGQFTIHIDNVCVWDRRTDGGFPQIKELKQRVRDVIDPKRDLGHIDNK